MSDTYEKAWTHEGRPELNRWGLPPVDGPWMTEPDKVHWIDHASDLDCLAVRNHFGAWCGYVGLPPGHPLHGVGYDDAESRGDLDVHGGLTFASACRESTQGEGYGICHAPLPGRPHDLWWLGFDCHHFGDLAPYDAAMAATWAAGVSLLIDGAVYRDLAYVKAETGNLARQVAQVRA